MDLSETTREVINRHPWELSRTQCTLKVFSKYITGFNGQAVYINSGAGDLYFDKKLLEKHEKSQVHAIDIAYKDKTSDDKRIHKYHFLEEMKEEWADYAVMMDSLEYFGIERLGGVGGPAINTAFLDAGLLDEVIVLIGAGIDGRASFPPVFNRSDNGKKEPTPLKLVDVKKYSSGAVFIRYKTN